MILVGRLRFLQLQKYASGFDVDVEPFRSDAIWTLFAKDLQSHTVGMMQILEFIFL